MEDARHYSLANVDALWTAGNPIVLPIAGTPACHLHLHPSNGTIRLTTPFTPPEPDVAKWRNISFKPVAADAGDLAELTVVVEDNVHGAYGLLVTVADRLQLEDEPLAAAVATAIAKHRNIFAGKAALSQDKEVGLFGELLVLEVPDRQDRCWPGRRVLARAAQRGARLRLRRRASGGQDDRRRAASAHSARLHTARAAAGCPAELCSRSSSRAATQKAVALWRSSSRRSGRQVGRPPPEASTTRWRPSGWTDDDASSTRPSGPSGTSRVPMTSTSDFPAITLRPADARSFPTSPL